MLGSFPWWGGLAWKCAKMGKKEMTPELSFYKGKAIFQNEKDVIPFQAEWENPS